MSMPTHECCWLITNPDGKTAEGDDWIQPHVQTETHIFYLFIYLLLLKTENVCVQVYISVINCNRCDFLPAPTKIRRQSACASIWFAEIRLMYWTGVLERSCIPQYLRIRSNVNSGLDWHLHTVCWRYLTISHCECGNKWMLAKIIIELLLAITYSIVR